MKIQDTSVKQDLSLLAIDAAEELERLRKKLPTEFNSVKALSMLLQESFSREIDEAGLNLRLDHTSVFTSAISNSFGNPITKKTISQIASEAVEIASRLSSEKIGSEEDELQKLISFCVALSDSAALYKEELDELRKHVA